MPMMTAAKRLIGSLLYIVLLCLLASGCGKGAVPAPEPPTDPASVGTEPEAVTEPVTENPPVKVIFETVDMSAFEHSGMTLQRIFPCDGETILFFTAAISEDGTISEATVAYSYSVKEKRFRTAGALLGTVALFPEQVLDDGTVVLVVQDSESYEYTGLLYLDPVTLAYETGPLPPFDFNAILVSPNRQYAAFSAFDGIVVTDISFETELFRLDSRPVFDGEEDPVEMIVPVATAWSKDSSALSYMQTALGDAYPAGIVSSATWEAAELEAMTEKSLHFIDGSTLFYTDIYSYLPAGIYDLATDQFTVAEFDPQTAPDTDVCAIAVSPSGRMVCISYITGGADGSFSYSASISDPRTGRELDRLTMESGPRFGCFEQVFFSRDEKQVYLVSSASLHEPRVVYIYPIGNKDE